MKHRIVSVLIGILVLALVFAGCQGEKPVETVPRPSEGSLNVESIPGFVPGDPYKQTTPAQTQPDPTTTPVPTAVPETTPAPTTIPVTTPAPTTPPVTTPAPTTPPVTTPAPTTPPITTPAPTTPPSTEPQGPVLPAGWPMLSDPYLAVSSIGGYSGNFLEDGSDVLVNNVAAVLITNNSDKMLQVAMIEFMVADGQVAKFQVTDLPAGTTVIALELGKRTYSDEDDYSFGQVSSGYIDTPSLMEDTFTIDTSVSGKLTLTNLTDQSYGKVYVYYKYVQQGGAYLGGITYRVPFENVGAGATMQSLAGHFNPSNSQIMAVVIMPEE